MHMPQDCDSQVPSVAAVAFSDRVALSRVQREASMHSVATENWRTRWDDNKVSQAINAWGCSTAEKYTLLYSSADWQSRQRIHICMLHSPVGEKLLSPSCPLLQAVWDENLVNNSCFMVPCLPSAFQPQVTGGASFQLKTATLPSVTLRCSTAEDAEQVQQRCSNKQRRP